jgi:hypothetical protein
MKFHQVWKEENYKWPIFKQWEILAGSQKIWKGVFYIYKKTFICNL